MRFQLRIVFGAVRLVIGLDAQPAEGVRGNASWSSVVAACGRNVEGSSPSIKLRANCFVPVRRHATGRASE